MDFNCTTLWNCNHFFCITALEEAYIRPNVKVHSSVLKKRLDQREWDN